MACNRKYIIWFFTLILCFSVLPEDSYAQLKRRNIKKNNRAASKFKGQRNSFTKVKQYASAGISLNALNYFGDITPASSILSTKLSFTRPGFSIWGAYRVGPRFAVEGSYSWGTVSSSDFESADPTDESAIYRYIRNLSFRNRINEFSAVFVTDYLENNATYISRVQLTPYAFIGIAGFLHNPQGKVDEGSALAEAGQWVKLRPLGTEGQNSDLYNVKPYSTLQIAVPFGLGVRYRLNQVFDLSFQVAIRYLFTDYIDDVSGNYVDLGALDSDLARAMADRSLELTSALKNEARDFTAINAFSNPQTYVGVDGNTYQVLAGYGSDTHPSNIRGNINDNDFLVYTQIRFSYIIGGSFNRAKYR